MSVLTFDKCSLVFDAASTRVEDTKNGFLRVSDNPFTREQVVQYRGHEIPDWQLHGLERDKLYNVYRPADELKRPETIASLNGIPLLLEHETYDPDNPPVRRQIGSAGTDAKWVPPYLTNSLTLTSTKAINLLKSGAMKELSLGYYYDPVFKPGKAPNGDAYDVKMTNITANHIALVEEGRAGHDVAVHDSKPKGLRELNNMDENQNAILQALQQTIASLQSISELMGNSQQPKNEPLPQATDEDDDQALDDDNEEDQSSAITDPAAPETNEDYNEDEPDLDDDGANDEEDDQAQDEDDDPTEDDEDEDPALDEDDDQAQDEDEDQAQDNDEEAIKAALEEAGLSEASDEIKAAFIQGMKKAAAASRNVAQDSKRAKNVMSRLLVAKVKKEVRKAVHDARLKDKAKIKAANEVRGVLGAIDAMAYDSASTIYKAALSKLGYSKQELKRLSGNESRAAYRGARRGGMSIKRRSALATDSKRRESKTDAGFKKLFNLGK